MEEQCKLSIFDDCEHLSLREGYCENCGLDIGPRIEMESGYIDSYMMSTKSDPKNYDKELNKIDCISEELKNKVSDNLSKEKRSTRAVSRKLDVFCQVYVSGAELNELHPHQIVKSLDISGRNLNKTIRNISGTGTKNICDQSGDYMTCSIVSISPVDSLKEICDVIEKIAPYQEEIKELITQCIRKSPSILNERPKHIAAGFVKYFCQVRKITIRDIGSYIDLSNPTINQYSTKVKTICEKHDIKF